MQAPPLLRPQPRTSMGRVRAFKYETAANHPHLVHPPRSALGAQARSQLQPEARRCPHSVPIGVLLCANRETGGRSRVPGATAGARRPATSLSGPFDAAHLRPGIETGPRPPISSKAAGARAGSSSSHAESGSPPLRPPPLRATALRVAPGSMSRRRNAAAPPMARPGHAWSFHIMGSARNVRLAGNPRLRPTGARPRGTSCGLYVMGRSSFPDRFRRSNPADLGSRRSQHESRPLDLPARPELLLGPGNAHRRASGGLGYRVRRATSARSSPGSTPSPSRRRPRPPPAAPGWRGLRAPGARRVGLAVPPLVSVANGRQPRAPPTHAGNQTPDSRLRSRNPDRAQARAHIAAVALRRELSPPENSTAVLPPYTPFVTGGTDASTGSSALTFRRRPARTTPVIIRPCWIGCHVPGTFFGRRPASSNDFHGGASVDEARAAGFVIARPPPGPRAAERAPQPARQYSPIPRHARTNDPGPGRAPVPARFFRPPYCRPTKTARPLSLASPVFNTAGWCCGPVRSTRLDAPGHLGRSSRGPGPAPAPHRARSSAPRRRRRPTRPDRRLNDE